jgi:hypothetical protein
MVWSLITATYSESSELEMYLTAYCLWVGLIAVDSDVLEKHNLTRRSWQEIARQD